MKRFFLFTIISLLAALGGAAKSPVKISGTVTDDQNEGLEFVTVTVQGTAIGTITGEGGRYTLTAPAADTIRVVFTCIGFEESRRRLIDPSGEVTVIVKMTPASYALGGVKLPTIRSRRRVCRKSTTAHTVCRPTLAAVALSRSSPLWPV